jgi:hypothetical protein
MAAATRAQRSVEGLVLLLLVGAGLYVFATVYAFSQARFFTIDEYQYGHATWLVANGALPYVDFFEHHLPGSYVLHAPLFVPLWDAETGALLLRKIVFVYWAAVSLLAGLVFFDITRNRFAALLVVMIPPAFGFSLMSAVDYRADNFGAAYFLACLLLLERNRGTQRRALAVAAGILATLAAFMTQKMAFVAGGSLLALLAIDGIRRLPALRARRSDEARPFIACPVAFVGSAAALGVLFIAIAGAFGMLPRGFEITILDALEHERHYKPFSLFGKGYVAPFWQQTWPSTAAIVFFAGLFFTTEAGILWAVPVALSLIGGSLMLAPYPYNFVFLCWVVALGGVRGAVDAIERLRGRHPALRTMGPALYLVPLLVLGSQLAFVDGTTSNAHQIRLLEKIAHHGSKDDAVIDNQGGAMFNPDASYYFHHGNAHRKMYADYMRENLQADYRESRALFWIRDSRFKALPHRVQSYLTRSYVHGGEGLYVLGRYTRETAGQPQIVHFDAIRSADYWFHLAEGSGAKPLDAPQLSSIRVNGEPVARNPLPLDEGLHEIEIPPNSPAYIVTPADASFFERDPGPRLFVMFFEYGRRRDQTNTRTDFSFSQGLAHAEIVSLQPNDPNQRLASAGPDNTFEQRPGSVIRYHLQLPDDPRLRGHARLRGDTSPEALENGSLTIDIRSNEQSETLVAVVLTELRNANMTLDRGLAPYAGTAVDLTITFQAPRDAANRRHLLWTNLRIDTPRIDPD